MTDSSSDAIDTLRQPLITKVIFPDFSVKINNTGFSGYRDDNNKFIYSGDTTVDKVDVRNYRMWILNTKRDSVDLSIADDNGLNIGKMEILSGNKTDRFEISYSFKFQIVAENKKYGTLWESMMPYKKIKDSLSYYFKAPEHNTAYSEMGLEIKEIKKKFNLRDTAFKKQADNGDYSIYTEDGVIFKNLLCEIPYIPIIYFKIDRFNQNKLVGTKYVIVDFNMPE